jgi:hypothetical protein
MDGLKSMANKHTYSEESVAYSLGFSHDTSSYLINMTARDSSQGVTHTPHPLVVSHSREIMTKDHIVSIFYFGNHQQLTSFFRLKLNHSTVYRFEMQITRSSKLVTKLTSLQALY